MRTIVSPTVFALNKKQFDTKFYKLIGNSKYMQIDFMDGKFVPKKSVQLKSIPNLKKYKMDIEAHLMVNSPFKWIPELKKLGFSRVLIHYEAFKTEDELIQCTKLIKKHGMKPALVLNPSTKIKQIEHLLPKYTRVMLMGVVPGAEGQSFITSTYSRIKQLRKLRPKLQIEIDGGVNLKTIKRIINAGANIVNSGSFISGSDNPKAAIKQLKDAIKN